MRHLVEDKGLAFVEAAIKVANERKKHSGELDAFRRGLVEGTPKMRLLARDKIVGPIEVELRALEAGNKSADTIIRAGLLRQQIHDYDEAIAKGAKKPKHG